jgi:hypothetical protein
MKHIKYSESIHCPDCTGPVRMMDCHMQPKPFRGKYFMEFDCACVTCGKWFSASRDREYLQFAEREFCQKKGLAPVGLKKETKTAQPHTGKRKAAREAARAAAPEPELEEAHS